ncbi:toll/interleukin-1 receptor domain-containing protein [Sphingomonas sabuli]|uniref:Toll/interleukin-1 receptor domain-containing protein n=1 Tax=Sphingomonas sabuli TaxID=2764186 RepID=A0A7G9L0N4_9SPHN|nr:toll/interleukin-1 receptor domain-containing protein [Sphingomonas sabuli]QNM82183.1 toll/interleukin-1 receptor domain-containing protein [Sphingomonas sabuli]
MNKWTRPFEGKGASAAPAKAGHAPAAHHYFAFLSYSHEDAAIADWLHGELEGFRVPAGLAGKLGGNGVIPNRLTPIFRDAHELAAGSDLTDEITAALAASRCLIVLCSPAAARSKWTNAEVDMFKRLHPDGCVIAAVIAGEPLASEIAGREGEECFPPALLTRYNRRGKPTARRIEPLAADLREGHGGRRIGFLKIVAGILGVGLDDLVQRDHLRRQRRLAGIAAGSIAGMLVAGTLAIAAISARDAARDERREAESLVGFMLGDLKEKLEPIGKLDALDGVGARVLQYYRKQDTSQLSDSGLMQRSRALSLMANVAYVRGDLASAGRLYREALDGTGEAVERDPGDAQRLFDHAQNVFWLADIARQQGRLADAEGGMREYKRLADRMVAIDPSNMQWRMEEQSADFNLGVMLFERRRFGEATTQFTRALATIRALSTADPDNTGFRVAATEAETWLADALASSGKLAEALALRARVVAELQQLLQRTGDVVYRRQLMSANRYLGLSHLSLGDSASGIGALRGAVEHSAVLRSREPENRLWEYMGARAQLDLANAELAAGDRAAAAADIAAGCATTARLLQTEASVQTWRANLRDCWQVRARAALSGGNAGQAADFANRAIAAGASVRSTDPVENRYAAATAHRLLGDARTTSGDIAGARAAWQAGLRQLPKEVDEKPVEMAEHAALLHRLGQAREAAGRDARLAAMGYKAKMPLR